MACRQFSLITHITFYLAIASLPLMSGCEGTKQNDSEVNPTFRAGRSIARYDLKYMDQYPSVSANGLTVVFTSARDASTSRIFKATRTAKGSSFSVPAKLLASSSFSLESSAKISPNGAHVLVAGTRNGLQSLDLCNIDGSSCQSVTTKLNSRLGFEFSQDSLIFSFVETSGSTQQLKLASVSAPTSPVNVLSTSLVDYSFISTSTGYRLAALVRATNASNLEMKLLSFANLSQDLSTGTTVTSSLSSAARLAETPKGAASTYPQNTDALVIERETSGATFEELTDLTFTAPATANKFKVTNQVKKVQLSSGTISSLGSVTAGYGITKATLIADGTTVAILAKICGRCQIDKPGDVVTYGEGLVLAGLDGSNVQRSFFKSPTSKVYEFSTATSFCDRDVNSLIDTTISDFDIAGTSSDYTMIWTSFLTGDPEIYAKDSTQATIQAVSNNRP